MSVTLQEGLCPVILDIFPQSVEISFLLSAVRIWQDSMQPDPILLNFRECRSGQLDLAS